MNIKKIIIASSAPVHVINGLEGTCRTILDYKCSSDEDFAYDLTKNIQELEALNFSKTFSMNIMILRLGHIVNGKAKCDLNNIPLKHVSYCKGGWVCQYDVARTFMKAVETNSTGFGLYHIIGSYQ